MNLKKFSKYFLILLIIFLIIFLAYNSMSKKKELNFRNVCINNNCFEVEIARTIEEKRQGLMNRDNLPESKGMLFIYSSEGFYSFWMKNMEFPLDIIWINKDKEIVHIKKNVQPCLENTCHGFGSEEKAMYILEINSGLIDKIGIKIGDKIFFGI